MNHNKYEVRQKEYIRMEKELDELRDKLRNRPLIELKEPIHRGWNLNYILKQEILNRKDSPEIQYALSLGFKPNYIRNVKHVRMMRKGEKGYWWTNYKGEHIWIEFRPYVVHYKESEWEKFPPQVRKYFYLDRYNDHRNLRGKYRIFIPHHWVQIRVRPHFITHTTEVGGPIKKRAEFLEDKLEHYWRLKFGYRKSYPSGTDRMQIRDKVQKFKKNEVEDIIVHKLPLIYNS